MISFCTACMLLFLIRNPVVWWTYPLQHNVIFCIVLTMNNIISFYYYLNRVSLFTNLKWYKLTVHSPFMLIHCLELHLCLCSWYVIQWSGEAGCSCTMQFPAVLTMNNVYYVNAILNRVSLFLTKKWEELTTLMLIRAKPVIYLLVSLSGWQHYC